MAPRTPVLRSAAAGFTLLELLVVLVIIGLLAGYVGPKYFSQLGKSEAKVARAQMDAIEKALDHYRLDIGRYPTTEQGLAAYGGAVAVGARTTTAVVLSIFAVIVISSVFTFLFALLGV